MQRGGIQEGPSTLGVADKNLDLVNMAADLTEILLGVVVSSASQDLETAVCFTLRSLSIAGGGVMVTSSSAPLHGQMGRPRPPDFDKE